jgi:hypothetical protein
MCFRLASKTNDHTALHIRVVAYWLVFSNHTLSSVLLLHEPILINEDTGPSKVDSAKLHN